MRNQFYKVTLAFESNVELAITIACKGAEQVEAMVNANRVIYEKVNKSPLVRFFITDSRPTLQMTQEKYEEELMFCDIVEPGTVMPSAVKTVTADDIRAYNDALLQTIKNRGA